MRYRFRFGDHINALEAQAWLSGLKWFCRTQSCGPLGTRLVCVGDSQVWTHVLHRGRSSSRRLNHIATKALPWLIANDITIVPLWVASEYNPSDDPTRGASVRSARARPQECDILLQAIPQTFPVAWHVTNIAWEETMLAFDCTKGYEGEGPKQKNTPGNIDLSLSVLPGTRVRYWTRIEHFLCWLSTNYPQFQGATADSLAMEPQTLSDLLCVYLQTLAEQNAPRTWGVEVLAGWQHYYPGLQGALGIAWGRQRVWNRSQMTSMRIPLPLEIALAISVVAKCWGRTRIAVALLLTYHCMLRPGETASLRRQDLIFPSDIHGDQNSGVVCIQHSKTSTRFAQLQSVVVEDPLLLQLLFRTFGRDPPKRMLVHGGLRELVKTFIAIKGHLGLSAAPYVLAGYRGGGACEYLRRTTNLSYLQFRGRWTTTRSMWHYLQLGLAASTYQAVPLDTQKTIMQLAACASDVFGVHVDSECAAHQQ
eukprot:4903637-Amphidinium_carterae.1